MLVNIVWCLVSTFALLVGACQGYMIGYHDGWMKSFKDLRR